jgi:hypothetical protein
MQQAHEAALQDRLPEAELQLLLDQHRAGGTGKALAKALTYLAFDACLALNKPWPYSYLADHMMAIGTCIDRLTANDVPASDLPRYVKNEMRPARYKGKNEHKVKLPRRGRVMLADPEDVSWVARVQVDEELLDGNELKALRLLREGCTFEDITGELDITTHRLYKIIDRLKQAAA